MKQLLSSILATDLFAGLSESEATPVVQAGTVESFASEEQLTREGENSTELLLLLSGNVQAQSEDEAIDTRELSAEKAPIMLRQAGLLQPVPAGSTIVTKTPSTVFRLKRNDFDRLLQAEHVGAYKVALELGRNLANHVCSLREGIQSLCACCQEPQLEEELTAFRKQLLTEWNL